MKTKLFRLFSFFVILAIAFSITTRAFAANPAPKFYYPYQKETVPLSHAWLEVKSECFIPPVNFGYCEGKKVIIYNHGPKMATIFMKGNIRVIEIRQTIEIIWTEPVSIELDLDFEVPDLSSWNLDKVDLDIWNLRLHKQFRVQAQIYHQDCYNPGAAEKYGTKSLPHCDWYQIFMVSQGFPLYIETGKPVIRVDGRLRSIYWNPSMNLHSTGNYVLLTPKPFYPEIQSGTIYNADGTQDEFYLNGSKETWCLWNSDTFTVISCLKPGKWGRYSYVRNNEFFKEATLRQFSKMKWPKP